MIGLIITYVNNVIWYQQYDYLIMYAYTNILRKFDSYTYTVYIILLH